MSDVNSRVIALEGAHNVRDLGGYETAGGGVTRWRSVLRAGVLTHLTADARTALVDMGLATVIDLRGADELATQPNPFRDDARVAYRNVPLFHALAPIEMLDPDGRPFDMGNRYRQGLDGCQERFAEVFRTILEAEPGAVLFHCSAGKDRTGLIAALLLSVAGVSDETIVDDYALTATVAQPLLAILREGALARGAAPELVDRTLASPPETMRRTLDHLQAGYGGATRYVSAIGLGDDEVARLRARLAD
ncbi:protein-tyrosine phosphatase [Amorphus suaedae]